MNSAPPPVAVILVNWNGWQDTIECLASLQKLNYPDFKIFVVDNGSTDNSAARLRERRFGRVEVIETGQNLGFAGGNNVGLRKALEGNFQYFWLLNNDTTVDPDALRRLVERLQAKPGAGICGSTILYYDRPAIIWAQGGQFNRWYAEGRHLGINKKFDPNKLAAYQKLERKLDYVVGASMLVSRPFLNDIGLMNEEYFIFFEEMDWSRRARGRYSLAYAPASLVYHKVSSSIERKAGDKPQRFNVVADQYGTRNRLKFTLKYFPYALPVLYLSVLGYVIDRAVHGAWGNIAIIGKEFGAHLVGLFTGRR
jgi:GT2 family glycosyltransferase